MQAKSWLKSWLFCQRTSWNGPGRTDCKAHTPLGKLVLVASKSNAALGPAQCSWPNAEAVTRRQILARIDSSKSAMSVRSVASARNNIARSCSRRRVAARAIRRIAHQREVVGYGGR